MFWEHTLINLYIDILVSSIYRFLPSLHFLAEPGEAQKSLLQLINDFILFSPYDNIYIIASGLLSSQFIYFSWIFTSIIENYPTYPNPLIRMKTLCR
jgi:hypothetical protein